MATARDLVMVAQRDLNICAVPLDSHPRRIRNIRKRRELENRSYHIASEYQELGLEVLCDVV